MDRNKLIAVGISLLIGILGGLFGYNFKADICGSGGSAPAASSAK